MSTVVPFTRPVGNDNSESYGTEGFVVCGCQAGAEQVLGSMPVVLVDALGPLVTGLVCGACDRFTPVVNGRFAL